MEGYVFSGRARRDLRRLDLVSLGFEAGAVSCANTYNKSDKLVYPGVVALVRTVVPSAEARDRLPSYLKAFREEGQSAEPVVFGSHRKPEGVILSYERYERLIEFLDELAASEEVREALAKDTGKRVELADVARESGFDPSEFGL